MTQCLLSFGGERPDPVTAHRHPGNGYRAYLPALFRFSRSDDWSPFGPGGLNPYTFCDGDPVNHADPSGHLSWQAAAGIGLSLIGLLGAVFSAGVTLAVTGCLSAGLAAASGLGLVADAATLAAGAVSPRHPRAAAALGWLAFAAGLLSLGAGLAPAAASAARALSRSLEQLALDGVTWLARPPGGALAGEFRDARFLGRYWHNGQMRWSFRYEDDVPLGRRVNIVMDGIRTDDYLRARCEIMVHRNWINQTFTPARLRNFAVGNGELYNVYRLIIPDSGLTIRSRPTLARRFLDAVEERSVSAGCVGDAVSQGPVSGHLQRLFQITGELDRAGTGIEWTGLAQDALDQLCQQYGNSPGALIYEGQFRPYPFSQRGEFNPDDFR